MKLDLNKTLMGIDGMPYLDPGQEKETSLAQLFAKVLARQQKSDDPVKLFGFALKLAKEKVLDVDKSDLEKLKNIVKNDPHLPVLSAGQLLEIMNEVKEE